MQDTNTARQLPIVFNGQGWEYFRIWIVNLALTIITLGIYSAWAKVRNKQYFYGNTQVLTHSFQYHATGWQILKGRLIAILVFVIFQLVSAFAPIAGVFLSIALVVALPFFINSGLRFNARMTSWRNVRFDFQGSYGKAFMAFIVWPMLAVVSLGILAPASLQRQSRYIVNSHRYGNEPFQFHAAVKDYIRIVVVSVLFLFAIVGTMIGGFYMDSLWLGGLGYLALYLGFFVLTPILFNLYWSNVELKENRFVSSMSIPGYAWIVFTNSLAVLCTLGLLLPWAMVRMARFTANSLDTLDVGNMDQIQSQQMAASNALGEELGEVFDVDVGVGI